MPEEYTRTDYFETVQAIAEEAVDDFSSESERQDFVTESVDGNSYIIYDRGHEVVLSASRNEPDPDEARSMAGEDADWRKIRGVAAYLAMERDVWDAIRDVEKETVFEVQVGTVGTVYRGRDEEDARRIFEQYKNESRAGVVRVAGEWVNLLEDDVEIEEYSPEKDEPEWRRWKPGE